MAAKKRRKSARRKSKSSCGCPAGASRRKMGKAGTRCVKTLANGKWRLVKSKCS